MNAPQLKNDATGASTKFDSADQEDGRGRPYLKYGAALTAISLCVVGAIVLLSGQDDMPAPRRVLELTVVNIVPPPPPPPPQQQPMPEEKMVEQKQMVEPEIKQERPDDKPKDEPEARNDQPPGPLSLDAKAEGPGDNFGLGGNPGGRGLFGGGGTRWGWYASIVQQQIETALRSNPKTRSFVMQIQLRLWADATGRVTRVEIATSTGDASVDAVIRNEVFAGLTLREPPPKDMPMPMVTRITARRPT
jgi:protein TonB